MRPLLRLTALLMQLLVLQGAFLGGSSACALAQAPTPSAATGAHHEVAHHASHRAPADGGGGEQNRQQQQQQQQQHAPSHCVAAGACMTTALIGRTVVLPASVETLAVRSSVGDLDAPASVSTAPEPPPPRA